MSGKQTAIFIILLLLFFPAGLLYLAAIMSKKQKAGQTYVSQPSAQAPAAAYKQCPHCGASCRQDANFCTSCGKSLVAQCPFCEAPLVDPDEKYCTKCGAAINFDGYLPEVYKECYQTYEYECRMYLIDGGMDKIKGNAGKDIWFEKEPQNTYDNKAVAITLGGEKVGYVYRGKTQDMINDYIDRGWAVKGYISKYSVALGKAKYEIAFYKPLDEFESRRFRLVGVKKKVDDYEKRSDNLASCSVGDILTVEYNACSDKYIVYNNFYSEVGELPQTAAAYIGRNGDSECLCILDELNDDYDGNISASVKIYLM